MLWAELAAPRRQLTIYLAGEEPDLSITPQNTEPRCAWTLAGWQTEPLRFVRRDVGAGGVDGSYVTTSVLTRTLGRRLLTAGQGNGTTWPALDSRGTKRPKLPPAHLVTCQQEWPLICATLRLLGPLAFCARCGTARRRQGTQDCFEPANYQFQRVS